jgi:signal recognition particle GTPase
MENKYQELIEEIKEAFDKDDIDTLNEIYDEKIFDLTKNLSKIQNVETVNKFNNLEDILIGYIELHKEYTSIKDELDKSAEELESLF